MTTSELEALETALGRRLPSGYRDLLTQVGWIEAPHGSMLGAGADVPPALDLLAIRRSEAIGAEDLLPVARDADGRLLWIDPAHAGPYEPPLVRSVGRSAAADPVAHDLASWLVRRLDETTG